MGAWMAIVACACAPVITLSVLMLRPLQPVAGVVAALGEYDSDGESGRVVSPQMALVFALLALPTVPNAVQVRSHVKLRSLKIEHEDSKNRT